MCLVPIYISLTYEPAAELSQEKAVATPEEEQEAVETIVETFEMLEAESEK
ncbi:MAG: hypothetical protein LH614_21640 [Pyrinomonadaceae bacterium]|nr:hypothetical protein [Pyrinomonadaceae bacterium]